jgi:hypothetical protein
MAPYVPLVLFYRGKLQILLGTQLGDRAFNSRDSYEKSLSTICRKSWVYPTGKVDRVG